MKAEATQVATVALAKLSPAQRRVLAFIGAGKMTKEIASEMNLSAKGVEYHRRRIYALLNLKSVGEAVRFAITSGLTS